MSHEYATFLLGLAIGLASSIATAAVRAKNSDDPWRGFYRDPIDEELWSRIEDHTLSR